MAIRGRIKTEIKGKIVEMAEGDYSIEDIAKKTGASVKQVISVLEKHNGTVGSESPEINWKEKYLSAHVKLVEHGIE